MDTTAIRDAALRCRAVLLDGLRTVGVDLAGPHVREAVAIVLLRAAAGRMLRNRSVAAERLNELLPLNQPPLLSNHSPPGINHSPPLNKGGQGGVLGSPAPCLLPRSSIGVAKDAGSVEIPRRLDAILDDPLLAETWRPGNEEALGWLYQYFNEPDLEVFRGSRPPKVSAEMLAAKTQLFTPQWIVRFLVENTLGRLWLQMHPDSRLADQLGYVVPPAEPLPPVPMKPLREIRVLDPACGAMHFGLAVFDLLMLMYREELDRAGEPGWPRRPSVSAEVDIPAAILSHNLFGFDIDPLAVQIARLVLFLKAAGLQPGRAVIPTNLYCDDVLMSRGEELYEAIDDDGDPAFDALFRPYDVVVTNPPYLDSRDYDDALKEFIAAAYPVGKRNLYAAFLERCLELMAPGGRLGIITPQTFMFISSFARLRALLRNSVAIETLVQTGLNTFPDAVVDAAFYVLRREDEPARRDRCAGTYFRLTRPRDPSAKQQAFERAVAGWRAGKRDESVHLCRQGDFDHLPGRPWVYWVTPKVRELFDRLPAFSEMATPIVGLQTSDNFRFLRYWWEVYFRDQTDGPAGSNRHIAFGCTDRASALATGRKWFPHIKGGDFRRWYGNQEYVVNWADDGAEIRSLGIESGKVASRPQNMDYYFRSGVTWTHTSSRGLSVRILPLGFICNVEGMAAFQNGPAGSSLETMAIMNSSFAAHVIGLLNPTVHFGGREVGDLPYPRADARAVKRLESHVSKAIELARQDSREDETTWEFITPPDWRDGLKDIDRRREQLAEIERLLDDEVYELYGLGPEDRAAIEADVNGDPPQPPLGKGGSVPPPLNKGGQGGVSLYRDSHADTAGAGFLSRDGVGRKDSPDEVYEKGFPHQRATPPNPPLARGGGADDPRSRRELAFRWVSYALGVVLGRFRPGVRGAMGCGHFEARVASSLRSMAVPDGIAELSEDERDDLAVQVLRAIELMLGEEDAEAVVAEASGRAGGTVDSLRKWLAGGFFRRHLQQYRGRPVYWLLQSPKRRFSAYIHYEQLNASTLRTLRGSRYLRERITQARRGRDDELPDDLQAFDAAIDRVLTATDERGRQVGWRIEPDDGVLINAAPLRELMPLWSRELSACWNALERGDYDWSFTARRYWSDRALAACRTNQSYALAHGLTDTGKAVVRGKPRSRRKR